MTTIYLYLVTVLDMNHLFHLESSIHHGTDCRQAVTEGSDDVKNICWPSWLQDNTEDDYEWFLMTCYFRPWGCPSRFINRGIVFPTALPLRFVECRTAKRTALSGWDSQTSEFCCPWNKGRNTNVALNSFSWDFRLPSNEIRFCLF